MITFYRSVNIAHGKYASAVAFARDIAGYVEDKTGIEVRVETPIGGDMYRIGWSSQYPSLAVYEEITAKLSEDAKYMELAQRGIFENFVSGTWKDELRQVL